MELKPFWLVSESGQEWVTQIKMPNTQSKNGFQSSRYIKYLKFKSVQVKDLPEEVERFEWEVSSKFLHEKNTIISCSSGITHPAPISLNLT